MSEEFLRVAKKEVSDDISAIGNLLKTCSTDSDVQKTASEIEKHIHKIKGLAPMMGQVEIGEVATLLDTLLKLVVSGRKIDGIYETLCSSFDTMDKKINGLDSDMLSLRSQILQVHKSVLQ